ncbi:MAG: 5'/3'-nucleotidase SurE [Chloroflexota bacterium]|nr:5'/3'-nucleotidase SurE [Chloroflexota bacterium]
MSSHILVTNDDGVTSPGILALKQALEALGQVTVFAPDRNWSAAGHSKTMHKPLRIQQVVLADGSPAYTTNGAPSDCVGLALLGAVPVQPDLVVSGINQGPNLGHDITYSGTVAGAMEAVVGGLPAIAVSMENGEWRDFDAVTGVVTELARLILERGLPPNTLLNVNAPARSAGDIAGVAVTRLGRRVYKDVLIEREDPKGRPYYWIGGEPPGGVVEDGTDIGVVARGFISVTPLTMDMTNYPFLKNLREWLALSDSGSLDSHSSGPLPGFEEGAEKNRR